MEANSSWMERAGQWPTQTRNYFEELQQEMRRVTWPTWKQVRATTTVVIVAVFAFAAYFALVDSLVAQLINKLFDTFSK
jgi:preprotein translocase subunit SecE